MRVVSGCGLFVRAASLGAVAFIAACGGGGGGSSSAPPPPPPPPPPPAPAFTDANVIPVTAGVFNLLDALSVADEAPSLVANVWLYSRQQAYEIVCVDQTGSSSVRVPVSFLYHDNDNDIAPSPGDTARLQHGDCAGVSRTVDVSLASFDAASGRTVGTVQFDETTTGGVHINGSFSVRWEPSADRTALQAVLTNVTATRVTANDTSSISGATFERTLVGGSYSLSFSGRVTDALVGGEFTYTVSRAFQGDFLEVPRDGELIMTAGTSHVRIAPATDPQLRPHFFEYQLDTGTGYGAAKTARWALVTDGFTFAWDPNAAPEITSLTLTPAAPRAADTIVASYAASDLDGDALSYSTTWFVNNVEVGSGTQLPPGRFRKGDTVGFTLRVSDAKATVIRQASVVVLNTPPSNAGIAFTPAVVRSIDDVYTQVAVRDDDGDLLDTRYEWRKNGTVIAGQETQALDHAFYRKGDVITTTVTFNDGEASTSATNSITIKDTLAEMFIGDAPEIHFGQPMTIQMGGTDYDGDPLPGFVLEHGPAGMTVNRNTGLVSWTPSGPMFDDETEVSFGIAFDESGGAVVSSIVAVQDPGRAYPLMRTGLDAPQPLGLKAGDFDGNGVDEVLVVGRRGSLYELARASGGGYRQAWSYPFGLDSDSMIRAVAAADIDNADGKAEIFAAMQYSILKLDGTNRRFVPGQGMSVGGRPGFVVRDLAFGDIDRDGHPELVVLEAQSGDTSPNATSRITVWRLDTITPRTLDEGPYGLSIALGNVDADPGLEIVTGGGYVIDGVSVMQGNGVPTAVQWRRTPNFGTLVAVGDVDGDGRDEIVAVEDHANVRVYNALTQSLSFSITNTDTDALLVADIGGTIAKEIVIGDGPLGGGEIKAYRRSGSTTTQLFHVPAGGPNVPAIVAGDVDGDGVKELVWGATGTADLIVVAEANGVVQWSSAAAPPQTVTGPFVGGQLARTPTNPRAPLFASVRTGTEGLRLASMNPTSGDLTYSAVFPRPLSDDTTLHVVDYDNDLRDEALVTTEQSVGAYQMAYDFYGGTTEWTSAIIAGETGAVASAYGDLTGDGRADLVAVNAFGVIRAYDVFQRTLLFEKTIPELTDAVAVAIANVNGTGAPEIVVAGAARVIVLSRDGASAYGVTRLSQPAYIDVRDLLVTDIDGDGAPEIFVLYGSPGSSVQRLDGNLVVQGGFSLEWPSPSLTVEASAFGRKNLLLHGPGSAPSVFVVDPDTGQEIWHSPRLLGEIAPEGIHFVDVAGDGRLRMTIATKLGMFITR